MTPSCLPKAPELHDQQRDREVGIPPGRTRQHPDTRPADQPWLATEGRNWLAESYPIGTDAEDGHPVGLILTDLASEFLGTCPQLMVGEFSRGCGWTMDEIGQADAPAKELPFLLGY